MPFSWASSQDLQHFRQSLYLLSHQQSPYIYQLYQFAVPETIITLLINYMNYKIKKLKKNGKRKSDTYLNNSDFAEPTENIYIQQQSLQ